MASPARARIPVPKITIAHEPPETVHGDAAEAMQERNTASESVKTAATVRPTERQIAIVAYLLWLVNGCPEGTDREDWLRAEAMLNAEFAAQSGSPSQPQSSPCRDTRTAYDILAEFRLDGHWEVWESEWGGARWVCDSGNMVV